MSIQAVAWVLDFSKATYGSRLVLLSIANHCDKYGTNAWPKIETIAEESLLSVREVAYAINDLVRIRELKVEKGKGKIGRNLYSFPLMRPANLAGDTLADVQYAARPTCKMPQRNKEEPSLNQPSYKSNTFVPPSLKDVTLYCQERKNSVDPEKWFDYYCSNGWRVGRNPMKNWEAAVRTWERHDHKNGQGTESAYARRVNANKEAIDRICEEIFGPDDGDAEGGVLKLSAE
jgi:hypothetical protein